MFFNEEAPMPKVTEAHVEARRAQIIDAACKCFNRNGFHGTTIRDICREAGLSTGALYGYFKGKAEILEALAEMGRRNTRALFTESGEKEGATRSLGSLMGMAMRLLDAEVSRDSARLDVRLWGEALHTEQLHRLFLKAFDNLKEPFEESLRLAQQRGEVAATLDPEAVARVMIAICLGFEVQMAMAPDADYSGSAEVVSALLDGSFVVK
jgi:AcrR family transcriptional regulator